MNIIANLRKIVQSKHIPEPKGIFSICTSNPYIITFCMQLAKEKNFPLLIESTCNQVNQFGGYTRLTPQQFVNNINDLALENKLSRNKVLLGGDHLGPFPWQNESANIAMRKSIELVQAYVRAGYTKIHLDASMACFDDPKPLPKEVIADRQVLLCQVAVKEISAIGRDINDYVFVVGSEVPSAGGALSDSLSIEVSSVEDTKENILLTKKAFLNANLEDAWHRTLAFVVQPGVEFSNSIVHPYDRSKASGLSSLIEEFDNLVYEAHSTDYQTPKHLKEMVHDHFAILKVGPALTFALREGLFSLFEIERELASIRQWQSSDFKNVLEKVMLANPVYWNGYFTGKDDVNKFNRQYSLLDRSRYYLSIPEVDRSILQLFQNLSQEVIPISLLGQYLSDQLWKVKEGVLQNNPIELLFGKISDVINDYIYACDLKS